MRNILFTIVFALSASLTIFADSYDCLVKYNSGDSLVWFYDIREKAQDKERAEGIVEKIYKVISENKISDEAFRLACNLIKPIADDDCIDVLAPYLLNETRCPFVCDVLAVLDDSDVDDALAHALKNPKATQLCKKNIVATMALRGKDKASVIATANDKDKKLALYATTSLARFNDATGIFSLFDISVVDTLNSILAKNDFRKEAAEDSLVEIANRAILAGEKSIASSALENVSQRRADTVFARSRLMDETQAIAYLDSLIAEGGDLTNAAGRAINGLRTFENSSELIKKFPTLNAKAKLVAMGGFMITGDTRFYPIIAGEMDSKNSDIQALAIYSARFLCTDEANFVRIYEIYKSGNEFSHIARNVLVENPSYAVQRVLKQNADAGDMSALEILISRGDEQYRMKLWNMFFDAKTRTPAVCRMLEQTITSGQINLLATNYKVKDDALSKEITKIIIKKMMQYRLSREYIAKAVKIALEGNLSKDDANYKFIVSRLKIKDLMK